jgi:hypothetical protein
MENKMETSKIKRKIQIGFISFVVLSILGYIFYPIQTLIGDIIIVWLSIRWAKKIGVKTTFLKKKK